MTESGTAPASSVAVKLPVRDDHWCFGCGRLNPSGLHLDFWEVQDGDGVWTTWTPSAEHQGFPGIVHGGLISTVLDEVMGWAISHREIWAVTGKMDVTFRKPVEIGVQTRATGRIVRDTGRKLDVVAELRTEAGEILLAEARAIFVRVPEETAIAWQRRYIVADAAP